MLVSTFQVAMAQDSKAPQNILIQLKDSTNDLHAGYMAFKVGNVLLKKKQVVTIFLNLEAVRIADERQPLNLKWGLNEKTLEDYYNHFVSNGGKIFVCPHCAKAVGLGTKQIRKGAQLTDENKIAELILNADKIMDY
jgi:predicted peroxiredoxin